MRSWREHLLSTLHAAPATEPEAGDGADEDEAMQPDTRPEAGGGADGDEEMKPFALPPWMAPAAVRHVQSDMCGFSDKGYQNELKLNLATGGAVGASTSFVCTAPGLHAAKCVQRTPPASSCPHLSLGRGIHC